MPLADSATVREMIHGVEVNDPYRWLEDCSLPQTDEWIKIQQERCNSYFSEYKDLDGIRMRVRECLDREIVDQPAKVAGRYFYRRRNPGMEQGCLFVRELKSKEEHLLVDPSKYGPYASVGIHSLSVDGSLLAYEFKQGGEDRASIHIVEVKSKRVLIDKLEAGYSRGFSFTADNLGFYYCHEAFSTSKEHAIFHHLFEETAPDQAIFRVARTHGSRLVLTADQLNLGALHLYESDGDLALDFWVAQLNDPQNWKLIFSNKSRSLYPILKYGRIFAIDYAGAHNGQIIELSSKGWEPRRVIPENDATIRQVAIAANTIFVLYVRETRPYIGCWTISGQELAPVSLPEDGTVQLIPAHGDESVFYSYESFPQPPIIYEYSASSTHTWIWHEQHSRTNQALITTRRTSYISTDGTEIPITLVRKSSPAPLGPCPAILTSYGGFGVPATPQFSVLISLLVEFGCIFAVPNIRGGSEFGESWHDAGSRRNRQQAIGDFLCAAEWMFKERLTSQDKLAIFGASNGGLLVGAAMTQRPELFRAVLCISPLLDMVRYEHLNESTGWREEFGTVNREDDFHVLYSYSPYHHVQDCIDYPSALFVTGDKDERCNPAHVRKMVALLVGRDNQKNTVLLDYSSQRGHSPALPLSARIEAVTRRLAFICRELGIYPLTGGHKNGPCN